MVMAAVFNPQSNQRYGYPPSTNPFDAFFVDAAAAAYPGETGYNFKNESFTHTIFCEEGTATWCVYCPAAAENLKTVYDTYDYPFYFVAMIADKVQKAHNRLINDFNLYGYPTSFFDGGYKVVVGSSSVNTFKSRIIQSGARDVHDLVLSVSLVWAGAGLLDIEVEITNNEEMPNIAPTIPEIDGPTKGKPGETLEYTVVSTDIDGDDIYYCVDWGDDMGEICIGPFTSGEEVPLSHVWDEESTYTMKVKAKDTLDHESEYAELIIIIEKAKSVNTLFNRLLERLTILFPILGQILGL
jgi:thiol-disulfide isomerase/thioredoxin